MAEAVEELRRRIPGATVHHAVEPSPAVEPEGGGDDRHFGGGASPGHALLEAYRRADRRRFAETDGPFGRSAPVDPSPAPPGPAPDIVLALADRDRALEEARRARLGSVYVDPGVGSGGWLGFDELLAGRPMLESTICHVREVSGELREERLALHRSRVHPLSLERTRTNHALKLGTTLAAAVARLVEMEGEEEAKPEVMETEERDGGTPAEETTRPRPCGGATPAPGMGDLTFLIPTLVGRKLAHTARRSLTYRQWLVATSRGARPERLARGELPDDLEVLCPPADRFWADPFPVVEGQRRFVFVEEYLYETGRAHISVFDLPEHERGPAAGFPATRPEPVLSLDHHLSYPFIFRWKDEWFMIPESGARDRVIAYRARDFPGGWEEAELLLEGPCLADSTLWRQGDVWWLFAARQGDRVDSLDEELHLFRASSPFGPWTAHRKNPVKIDARSARPAGQLFAVGGELYRPAQDCAGAYGSAIVINRVRELGTSRYVEDTAARVEPAWRPGLVGTHTLNFAPGLLVVDGVRRRFGRRAAEEVFDLAAAGRRADTARTSPAAPGADPGITVRTESG